MLSTISLFTGAGGLDIGLEAAAFHPALCVEIDKRARETLASNRHNWRLAQPGDILALHPQDLPAQSGLQPREVALVVAGPVCQPFSHAARWAPNGVRGLSDPRSATLGACLDIVAAALPQALLLENVAGIAEGKDSSALEYIQSRLNKINSSHGTHYDVCLMRLNSADYGVPQLRKRTFILADRDGRVLTPPPPTHGNGRMETITAWDAIGDLDRLVYDHTSCLVLGGKWSGLLPSIPEGHNYLWHTCRRGGQNLFGWRTRYWTFLLKLAKNRPSWTLTAHPGPATGPFHWRNRRLSAREMCRLQTFPDDYIIGGSYQAQRRQLGNAVPCLLAEAMGREIGRQWFGRQYKRSPVYAIAKLGDCPPPEPTRPVPPEYLPLVGHHAAHPGPGRGPQFAAKEVTVAHPS